MKEQFTRQLLREHAHAIIGPLFEQEHIENRIKELEELLAKEDYEIRRMFEKELDAKRRDWKHVEIRYTMWANTTLGTEYEIEKCECDRCLKNKRTIELG